MIGANCHIGDHVLVEGNVSVGANVRVEAAAQLCDGTELEDDVIIGPAAVIGAPAVHTTPERSHNPSPTVVRIGATVGAKATIVAGITIGTHATVEPGAVATENVPGHVAVSGNPARIVKHLNTRPEQWPPATVEQGQRWPERVKGVKLYEVKIVADDIRGSLSVAQLGAGLPFVPARLFTVFDVPSRQVRGEHAHKSLHQWLVCLRGTLTLMVDDGTNREALVLNSPARAVHIPPMIWAAQYQFSPDAILLVAASSVYDPTEYIRDYDDFLLATNRKSS